MKTWLKKPLFWVLALGLVAGLVYWKSTSNLSPSEQAGLENNASISGTIKGAGGLDLILEAPSDKGVITVAQTTIESDGSFELQTNLPGLGIYNLKLADLNGSMLTLPLQAHDHLVITSKLNDYQTKSKLTGVKWATSYQRYMDATQDFVAVQNDIQRNHRKWDQRDIELRYRHAKATYEGLCMKLINASPSSPLNILLSMSLIPTTGFEDWNDQYLGTFKVMADAYAKTYAGQSAATNMQQQYSQLENAYFDYISMNNGSISAPEIALPTPSGRILKLLSLKGSYVLIDFWSSWCAPCKAEMPNVIKLYNTYKNKGLTVFSVSLDEDPAKWKAAIQSWGMTWPNHVSDLKGWNSSLPQTYGFDGIPYTVLLNKEGKIIGTNLRGTRLEEKLESLFVDK
ncbi:MAG: hypothetical protein RLZZ301_301 [Bacteroidota bacterium]|jgi:thiol-disulfide isomerase/thioredoxin